MAGVADEPLVAGAVRAAVAQRRPGRGLIHHSDYAVLCVKPMNRGAVCVGGAW
jgi:hypothetical protein